MQNPVGYTLNNGRAEMESFMALLTNEHLWYQYPHVITGAWATAGFFVLGISAINLLKGHDKAFFQKSMKIAAVFALIGSLLVAGVGHAQGQHLGDEQPMKMAAAEALWETEDPDPLALVAIIDDEKGENAFEIALPNMLSFMMHNSFEGEVRGIHELQAEMVAEHGEGNYIPPVTVCFWAFRVMVGAGGLMILFALAAMVLNKSGKLANNRLLLKLLGLGIALPYLANTGGWILAEMGRQPWIVYGLQTVYEGVSKSVSAPEVLISLIGFALVYTVLAVVDVYLLAKNGVKDIHDLDVDAHDLDMKGV
jgi:cytochrome d ubiquinol oxidase subunit I